VIVAFDLDGTLADITHRLHFIQDKPERWREFFRACVHDKPIPEAIAVVHALQLVGHTIEIWSGRSDEVRTETEAWLRDHSVLYSTLRMRNAGDHRDDAQVKGEWLDDMEKYRWPDLVFDDRQRMVDMWRSRGVRCYQVAKGDF